MASIASTKVPTRRFIFTQFVMNGKLKNLPQSILNTYSTYFVFILLCKKCSTNSSSTDEQKKKKKREENLPFAFLLAIVCMAFFFTLALSRSRAQNKLNEKTNKSNSREEKQIPSKWKVRKKKCK